MRWEIVVPGWVPDSRLSLNGRRRSMHWRQVYDLQNQAKERAIVAIWQTAAHPGGRSLVKAIDPARVTVRFTYPTKRRRDPDNLAAMAKPLLDSMVQEGILVDDDCEHITLTVAAEVRRGVTETRILVEDQ
jgi:Holliday junction resolvase RusA-like endonuclease